MEQVLIDKFTVPAGVVKEFTERMSINRNIIRKLPGFVSNAAYQRTEANSMIYVTLPYGQMKNQLERPEKVYRQLIKKKVLTCPLCSKSGIFSSIAVFTGC